MSIDIDKQVAYWRASAEEDWDVGRSLVEQGKTRHGLFFLHLALEKALKAHVCRATRDFAPKVHSLLYLVEKSGLSINQSQKDFLTEFDRFDLAGRYPGFLPAPPSRPEATLELSRAEEVYSWLINRL
jgi:HEPN domain-containing protein